MTRARRMPLFEQCRAQADAAVGGEYGERCDEQPFEEPAVGAFHPCPGEHDVCDGPLLAGRHEGEFRNVVPAVAQPGGEILFRPVADRRCFEAVRMRRQSSSSSPGRSGRTTYPPEASRAEARMSKR